VCVYCTICLCTVRTYRLERYTLIIWHLDDAAVTIVPSCELLDTLKDRAVKRLRFANASRISMAGTGGEILAYLHQAAEMFELETTETDALCLDATCDNTLRALAFGKSVAVCDVRICSLRVAACRACRRLDRTPGPDGAAECSHLGWDGGRTTGR
jgi:hypothetical protein